MFKNMCQPKKIFVEPTWKSPLSLKNLVESCPESYSFIIPNDSDENLVRFLSKYDFSYKLLKMAGGFISVQLLKSEFGRLTPRPNEAILTYSLHHLIFRKERWILDMTTELPFMLTWNETHLKTHKALVKNSLNSPYCRKILCQVNKGREAFLETFGDEFSDKVAVMPWAVPKKMFKKSYEKEKIKILFVNSGNINTADHFFGKGGAEVIESFKLLCRRYNNVELVIRSGMPKHIKEKCSAIQNITVIDKPIPWKKLEKEWKSADIFILPNHFNTSAQAFLDAMSYGLPIVTTDTWANTEFVEDGKNGFVVHNSRAARFTEGSILHMGVVYFRDIRKGPSSDVVKGLVDKLSLLVTDAKLRKKLGEQAKYEIEAGKFSVGVTKTKLKRILDESTA